MGLHRMISQIVGQNKTQETRERYRFLWLLSLQIQTSWSGRPGFKGVIKTPHVGCKHWLQAGNDHRQLWDVIIERVNTQCGWWTTLSSSHSSWKKETEVQCSKHLCLKTVILKCYNSRVPTCSATSWAISSYVLPAAVMASVRVDSPAAGNGFNHVITVPVLVSSCFETDFQIINFSVVKCFQIHYDDSKLWLQ